MSEPAAAVTPATGGRERHGLSKIGIVTSSDSDKTVLVRVDRLVAHGTYRRTVRRSKKFMAHDPNNECRVGDRVMIVESRPLSKRKRWRVVKVVEASKELR